MQEAPASPLPPVANVEDEEEEESGSVIPGGPGIETEIRQLALGEEKLLFSSLSLLNEFERRFSNSVD